MERRLFVRGAGLAGVVSRQAVARDTPVRLTYFSVLMPWVKPCGPASMILLSALRW